MNRFTKYLLTGSLALFSVSVFAAGDVNVAPATVAGFFEYLTAIAAAMGPLASAAIAIMGVIILVMGVISLGGVVAGVLKKIFG